MVSLRNLKLDDVVRSQIPATMFLIVGVLLHIIGEEYVGVFSAGIVSIIVGLIFAFSPGLYYLYHKVKENRKNKR